MNTTTICDWGGCREAATRLLRNYCDDATVAEVRPMCSRHAYCRHPGTVEAMPSRRRFEVRGARNGALAVGPVGSFAGSHMADWQPLSTSIGA